MGFNESIFSCWGKWMLEFNIVSWTACSQPPDHQIHQVKSWEFWDPEMITLFSFKEPRRDVIRDKIWSFDYGHWELSTDFHSRFKRERMRGRAQTTEVNFLLFLVRFGSSNIWSPFAIIREITQEFCIGDMDCN